MAEMVVSRVEGGRLVQHGGDLAAARNLFPGAPLPWIDLSTGINPRPYPIGTITPDGFARLPELDALAGLEAAAAEAYGAKEVAAVVAAPGTQALIQWLPRLRPARRVGILGFTYGEHQQAWGAAGAEVVTVEDINALATVDVAVVVNPNNPDGRLVAPEQLRMLATTLSARGGLLVVDEAFMDVVQPDMSLIPTLPDLGALVLRSFGKTYGLGGLRLGFAVASDDLARQIRTALGPWAVSGPAIEVGIRALCDTAWLSGETLHLSRASRRLDQLLIGAGCDIVGGTPLFRLARSPDAPAIFEHLARHGILCRPFAHRPDWLRFGLCDGEAAWTRLSDALTKR
ncbi:threonine-phosphate decarboxylase CobD [Lichenihabitans sp. PAMC28606]|uniref:threonine-phosphate decarboxylase CobD n=1 Tax=Lichenihabitans sp. PAMC28606 TaxID=2880932 RepID=UPI001D0A2CB4|nr:threonine-phosphate decarboxylase CobD [Lichenihabitans sp. PAMC28606]UDL96365.1 threonine-phosphate decarboxylase CobD [Lichenihabitans sp. PAMC28606]